MKELSLNFEPYQIQMFPKCDACVAQPERACGASGFRTYGALFLWRRFIGKSTLHS